MLRTNSKIAREGVKKLIMANCTTYDGDLFNNYGKACAYIDLTFRLECYNTDNRRQLVSREYLFSEWAEGCPCGGLFDYYLYCTDYNAIDLLGDILQETEEERHRYTEYDACTLLTHLIYSEVLKQVCKIRG